MRIENAMGQKWIDHIIDYISNSEFPLYFQPYLAGDPKGERLKGEHLQEFNDPEGAYIFTHCFVRKSGIVGSEAFSRICEPIFLKLDPKFFDKYIVDRAVLVFTPYWGGKAVKSAWHTDQRYEHMILNYYFNTCNGYTEFKDGEIVESIADRLNTFSGRGRVHRSVSQTDKPYRMILNVNYREGRFEDDNRNWSNTLGFDKGKVENKQDYEH